MIFFATKVLEYHFVQLEEFKARKAKTKSSKCACFFFKGRPSLKEDPC